MLFFLTLFIKKCITFPQKYQLFFNIDNYKKCFLRTNPNIIELFMKDSVILNTGIMILKIQLCHHRNKLHF